MSEDVELRKCPHCGGEAFLDDINSSYRKDRGPLWAVGCANNDCIVETRAIHDDKLTAIAAWNRRPTPAPADASGWRPIESAPRGRNVLVHTETWGVTEAILGDDGWQIASMNGLLAKGDPTAWQPLPPPPGSTPPRPIDMGEITNEDYTALASAIGQGSDNFLRAVPEDELTNFSPRDIAMRFQVPLVLPIVKKLIERATRQALAAIKGAGA